MGARNRAALGISLESDALTVVVSEETGRIPAVQDGSIRRGVEPDALRQILHNTLLPRTDVGFARPFTRRRKPAVAATAPPPQPEAAAPPTPGGAASPETATPHAPATAARATGAGNDCGAHGSGR